MGTRCPALSASKYLLAPDDLLWCDMVHNTSVTSTVFFRRHTAPAGTGKSHQHLNFNIRGRAHEGLRSIVSTTELGLRPTGINCQWYFITLALAILVSPANTPYSPTAQFRRGYSWLLAAGRVNLKVLAARVGGGDLEEGAKRSFWGLGKFDLCKA